MNAEAGSVAAPSLPWASVVGIGAVTPVGRDLNAITAALLEPADRSLPHRRVDDSLFSDPSLVRQMRRADRYARMAATAASDAWAASAMDGIALDRIGLIVSSGFGPHCRGFKFLDGMLDNGHSAASPTDFSHSVHGAASAYISGLFGIQGPSLNITDFETGFEEAVRLAQCWLADGACDRVLVGAAEELGEMLLRLVADTAPAAPIRLVPGEGSVFLMLASTNVAGIARINAATPTAPADLVFVDDPEPLHRPNNVDAPQTTRTATLTDHFGHSASSAAFQSLAAVLALRSQRPLGRTIKKAEPQPPVAITTIATLRPSSNADAMSLVIQTP